MTGLLDIDTFASLVTDRTRLVTVPHASNIVGKENGIARICELSHRIGARVIVDGVSFAPHTIPDVAALGADVYVFSLYKTYSVHKGLMVVRRGLLDELPNQSHFFNDSVSDKRLNPAGPDHSQVASAGAVLDFIQAAHTQHGGQEADSLRQACREVSALWRHHENSMTPRLLEAVDGNERLQLLGPATLDATSGHRCPTVAFALLSMEPAHSFSNSRIEASRRALVASTPGVCSMVLVSTPSARSCACRSCTTRRPMTSTASSGRSMTSSGDSTPQCRFRRRCWTQ